MLSRVYGVLVRPREEEISAKRPPSSETELAAIPIGRRILVMLLRTVFFGALVAIIVRLSSPQSETIWTVYETPGDLFMVAVGFAVCLWLVAHFFMFPKRAELYRFWLYPGLV